MRIMGARLCRLLPTGRKNCPMIASLIYQCVPVPCDLQRSLERNRSQSHTTRSGNRRQKCSERGYYNLYRNLNNPLLHTLFRLNVSCRRSDTWGLARSVLFPMAHWCLSPVCLNLCPCDY